MNLLCTIFALSALVLFGCMIAAIWELSTVEFLLKLGGTALVCLLSSGLLISAISDTEKNKKP